MPSTIPFSPGLVLGNIIDPQKIEHLKKLATAQKETDSAYNVLNASLLARHKLNMTLDELINLNASQDKLDELREKIGDITDKVGDNAVTLAEKTIASAEKISEAENEAPQDQIYDTVESPIDFDASDLKQMDLSSDTLSMDVQYVRNESNMDSQQAHATSVASQVSFQVSGFLSPKYASQMAGSAKASTYSQTSMHKIEGTIVITVNCTHKRADMFSPLAIDVDKAVAAWNFLNEDAKIDTEEDPEKNIKDAESSTGSGPLQILSGRTSGSSFVGLVHIVQTENSSSRQTSMAVASSVSNEIENNLFLRKASGKFGLDQSYSNNLKNLFSTSNVQSHCSVICMGCIPTIASNTVTTTVARMAPDPKEVMSQLAAIQGANDTEVNQMSKDARAAKTGESFMQLNNSYVTSVVSSLGSYDNDNNKVIDMNSLMTALDDFILKANEGTGGVPINFFIKPMTKLDIVKAYNSQYE